MHRHISSQAVLTDLRSEGSRFPRTVIKHVLPGWSAWNPANTSGPVPGPADVIYTQYFDGAIEVTVQR